MSTLLYAGKIIQGRPIPVLPIIPSYLIVGVGNTIADGSCIMTAKSSGVYSVVVPRERDPALDLTFDCAGTSSQGVLDQGILVFTTSQEGEWAAIVINVATDVPTATMSILGDFAGDMAVSGLLTLTLSLLPSGTIPFISATKKNWIKWSDIGELNFTVGKSNVAGERPLDWKGYVYAVKKLRGKPIVYGENGVSFLVPSGIVFGLDTIYRVGLKGKHAVAGDEAKHFFVDAFGQLWKLSDGMQFLDYSEYLSTLNDSLVVSYDKLNNLVYICDGSVGYVYDVVTGSLGKCQPNITGLDYQSGVQYVTASATITTDPFEICTDIYDLESRVGKTIFSLEFGTDVTTALYAAIDYRRSKAADFVQTPWYLVSSVGNVNITAYGREFRIRAKTLAYEYFELDYIKVNGVADAY